MKNKGSLCIQKINKNAGKTGSKDVRLFYFMLSSSHKKRYFSSRLNMKDFLFILKQTSLQKLLFFFWVYIKNYFFWKKQFFFLINIKDFLNFFSISECASCLLYALLKLCTKINRVSCVFQIHCKEIQHHYLTRRIKCFDCTTV